MSAAATGRTRPTDPRLTVAGVRSVVAHIHDLAGDPAKAHGAEDALHFIVLRAIADGHPSAKALAAAALASDAIPFDRWCA